VSDAPIEPQAFQGGVRVVDIGDVRVARGLTRRHRAHCRHLHLVYDDSERRVWCEDCESEVEPFDAFRGLVEQMDGHVKRLQRRERELAEAESFAARSRAVKALDEVWRSKRLTPLCPHCSEALLPEDMTRGLAFMDRDLARGQRARRGSKKR